MKRWLILALGLGIGLLATYAVLTGRPMPTPKAPAVDSTSAQGAPNAGSAQPLGEIREPSRARLREILRRDEEGESSR